MKTKKISLIASLTLATLLNVDAQNLITNPNFSDALKAPTKFNQINLATNWTNGNSGTADFYHKNAKKSSGMGIAENKSGSQGPFIGDGYTGIIAYFDNNGKNLGTYTEYIKTTLSSPLVAGQQYDVKFRVSLSEKSGRAISGLGVLISSNSEKIQSKKFIKGTPQVVSNEIIKDMNNWTEISGRFTAEGGETQLLIGVFNMPEKIERTVAINVTNNKRAYYYIDGVELTAFIEPDTDNDGVIDKEDKCPTIAGLIAFNGCPDTDNDGVTDADDKCPTVAGLKSLNGCPDTDNDGIADYEDKCPKVPGLKSNNGCPEIKKETLQVFEKALTGIQFESGKDVIKKSSYSILNDIAKIMTTNPEYNLEINGHTDSSGDEAKNLELSKSRAAAVKAYLANKKIPTNSMTSNGFGQSNPIADNKTPQGRAKNRRVEFKVTF